MDWKKNTIWMKLLTKTCHEVVFWSHERFVGLRFVDLVNKTFSQHHFHNNLKQFSISSAFSKIFETTRYTYLKSNLHQLCSNRSGCTEFPIFILCLSFPWKYRLSHSNKLESFLKLGVILIWLKCLWSKK